MTLREAAQAALEEIEHQMSVGHFVAKLSVRENLRTALASTDPAALPGACGAVACRCVLPKGHEDECACASRACLDYSPDPAGWAEGARTKLLDLSAAWEREAARLGQMTASGEDMAARDAYEECAEMLRNALPSAPVTAPEAKTAESETFWCVRAGKNTRDLPHPWHRDYASARREGETLPGPIWEIVKVTVEPAPVEPEETR